MKNKCAVKGIVKGIDTIQFKVGEEVGLDENGTLITANKEDVEICSCSPTAQVIQPTTGICSNCYGLILNKI
jgi:hypothetical protein